MSGAHCKNFPACMKISDGPRVPSCDKKDCPGRAGFLPFTKLQTQNLKRAFVENDIPWPVASKEDK